MMRLKAFKKAEIIRSLLDVVFGRDVSAKVSFEQSTKPSNDEDVSQVNQPIMPVNAFIACNYGNLIAYKSSADISGSPWRYTDADHVRGSSRAPVDLKDEWRNM
ncbi:hypothetical protein Tco_0674952 [Tanacetum coccineum]